MSATSPIPSSCSTSSRTDKEHGAQNQGVVQRLDDAIMPSSRTKPPSNLQPIWSQPRVKVAAFAEAQAHGEESHRGDLPAKSI